MNDTKEVAGATITLDSKEYLDAIQNLSGYLKLEGV